MISFLDFVVGSSFGLRVKAVVVVLLDVAVGSGMSAAAGGGCFLSELFILARTDACFLDGGASRNLDPEPPPEEC